MPTERIPGKPSTRRYTPTEREQAVRLVRQLRKELGTVTAGGRTSTVMPPRSSWGSWPVVRVLWLPA
jgi:hypothetical protein